MYKIDHATAVANEPGYPDASTPGYFTDGNAGTGQAATVLPAWWANQIQDEICNVIMGASLTLDKGNRAQLLAAISALIAASSTSGGVPGYTSKLKISVTSSTAITVTAAALVVGNGGGSSKTISTYSKSIGTGVAGVGGVDTGAIGSNSWYYVYAIAKADGTSAAVLSLSATAPDSSILATYPFYCRLGSVRTDGSSNLLTTLQVGRTTQYVVGSANVPNLPCLTSTNQGAPATPTWIGLSVSTVVPPVASKIALTVCAFEGEAMVAPNSSYGSVGSIVNPPPLAINMYNSSYLGRTLTATQWILLESSTIYYASSQGNGSPPADYPPALFCFGWEE